MPPNRLLADDPTQPGSNCDKCIGFKYVPVGGDPNNPLIIKCSDTTWTEQFFCSILIGETRISGECRRPFGPGHENDCLNCSCKRVPQTTKCDCQ